MASVPHEALAYFSFYLGLIASKSPTIYFTFLWNGLIHFFKSFFFFKIFLMWIIFKVFIEFVIILLLQHIKKQRHYFD